MTKRILALSVCVGLVPGCADDGTTSTGTESAESSTGTTGAMMASTGGDTGSTGADGGGTGTSTGATSAYTGAETSATTSAETTAGTGGETTDGGTTEGGTTEGATGSGSGTDSGGAVCPPDGAAIGQDCSGGAMCPECYTCQPFAGIVLQEQCQVLCDPDKGNDDCPPGLACVEVVDKGGIPWNQCM